MAVSFPFFILSREPLIIITVLDMLPAEVVHYLGKFVDKRIYFISINWWTKELSWTAKQSAWRCRAYQRMYSNIRCIYMMNTTKEEEVFAPYDIETIFCNHNAFIDEREFFPIEEVNKRYDAIYNARLSTFKRLELAELVNPLGIITYRYETTDDYESLIVRALSHATWINRSEGGYRWLSKREINRSINEACVGLCLSSKEGAMYGSVEYLLAGLPIVSTQNVGGRDEFFNSAYVKIIDPDPEAVRDAVSEMKKIQIEPAEIRALTIKKMQQHKERFFDLIQGIWDRDGNSGDIRALWKTIFIDRLVMWINFDELCKIVPADKAHDCTWG